MVCSEDDTPFINFGVTSVFNLGVEAVGFDDDKQPTNIME